MSFFTPYRLWIVAAALMLGWSLGQQSPSCCCRPNPVCAQSACDCGPALCGCPAPKEEKALAFFPLHVTLTSPGNGPSLAVKTRSVDPPYVAGGVFHPSSPRELLPRGPPLALPISV